MTLKKIWEQSQNRIKKRIGATSYETWFSALNIKEKNNNILLIETPDAFFKNWIVEHYKNVINDEINNISSSKIQIEFGVNPNIIEKTTQERLTKLELGFKESENSNTLNLNSRFTFENFVIGPSNRFACAACLAVAESPAKTYNPLFIYGKVGLGKTHLIQAITHKIKELHPHLKYCYISSERFTNELIDAIRTRSTSEFRKKYREIDVLLIDDIQFIAGKESTQEEFFHTFNYLHNNRKQIIITSDHPPKQITHLEERLTSRFAWGLIADIQPPDFETRVAILRKKVEKETVNVPEDVIFFIADQIKSNIRELEGALVRVAAYSLLEDKPITLNMTKIILKDMVKEATKNINVEMIQKCVCNFFKVSLNDLKAYKRNKNIILPRQIAMYLSRQLTNMSLPEIGRAFGRKDHATVMHSCKKIEKDINSNEELKSILTKITAILMEC